MDINCATLYGHELCYSTLREAINTKWNIKILDAKEGIGGHCLPKDSQMFLNLSRGMLGSSILEAAKKADLGYRRHLSSSAHKRRMVAAAHSPPSLPSPSYLQAGQVDI